MGGYWGMKRKKRLIGRGRFGGFRAFIWAWQKDSCKSIKIYRTKKIMKKY